LPIGFQINTQNVCTKLKTVDGNMSAGSPPVDYDRSSTHM